MSVIAMLMTAPAASGTREAGSARIAAKANENRRDAGATAITLMLTTSQPGLMVDHDSLGVTHLVGSKGDSCIDHARTTCLVGVAGLLVGGFAAAALLLFA